jgi:hypothetical protein
VSVGFLRRAAERRAALRRPVPQSIDFGGREVPLVMTTSPRARRLTLRADAATGAVRVTLPKGVALSRAAAFVAEQRSWLAARVARWPLPLPLTPGAVLPFRGEPMAIDWSLAYPRAPRLADGAIEVGGPADALAGRIARWLREEARAALAADCAEIAARLGRAPPRVRVGDPRGRWGSCSARGALAFSWRLILAPDWVRRAVAAHEVAHLVHHDHGRAFHALCATLANGDDRRATRWLRAHGAALHWVGRS